MKLVVLFIAMLFISCGESSMDYESLMADKVWLNYVGDIKDPYQFYYSSKTGKSYLYLRTGDHYTPFVPYKGTPETNPLVIKIGDSEGWQDKGSFKIDGNKMMFQDEYKTQRVSTMILEKVQDTTIGLYKYHKVISTHTDVNTGNPTTFKRISLSKIE